MKIKRDTGFEARKRFSCFFWHVSPFDVEFLFRQFFDVLVSIVEVLFRFFFLIFFQCFCLFSKYMHTCPGTSLNSWRSQPSPLAPPNVEAKVAPLYEWIVLFWITYKQMNRKPKIQDVKKSISLSENARISKINT